MQRLVLCIGLAVAGCKGGAKEKAKDDTPPTGSGSAITSASKLSVMKDGVAVPAKSGFFKTLPDGKIQLYVGEGGSCEQLLTNVFDGKQPHVLIDLLTHLAPDGSERRAIGDVYAAGPPETADAGGKVTVEGALGKGGKADFALDFTAKAAKLEVKGSISAESCGDQDTSKGPLPKAQHASTAVMTVADKAFPVKAALVKGQAIELSDFPRDCSGAWFIGVALEMGSKFRLSGRRFASEATGGGEGLTFTQGAKGTSDDGPTVQLTIGGSGKIGEYPVKLDGTIEALACP